MFSFDNLIGLDFETYAAVDLKKVGLYRYVNHPSFEVTLASIADGRSERTWEFPADNDRHFKAFSERLMMSTVCAHNAGFERAVLAKLGIDIPVYDSAVVSRVAGADSHLAGAARQLMSEEKLDEDGSLIRLFAKRQEGQVSDTFDRDLITENPDKWRQYVAYCERDAKLSRGIMFDWSGDQLLFEREMEMSFLTQQMNEVGWPVDVAAVHEMRRRYVDNLELAKAAFAENVDPKLNVSSHPQVKQWCADRGIRSTSFDKQHVERMVKRLQDKKLKDGGLSDKHAEVLELLLLKQELGGSSLKKLETILDVVHDGRAYDQYVHAGAAQTLRTSGRSIQMQNLPRLPAVPRDMSELYTPSMWTNDDLAENLRQVFKASHTDGALIVGDFASIESRALAYQAGEDWKTRAYADGDDVYKRQAMKIFGIHDIDQVSKEQRTTGKVGELSCGYGAGPVAVKDFAEKMGVQMSEAEAGVLVTDWRDANPAIVSYWDRLGEALREAVRGRQLTHVNTAHGITVKFLAAPTPGSLVDMAPNARSIYMDMWKDGRRVLRRVFHGCYLKGEDVHYYKPSHLKGGKPWKPKYTDPKTKRQVYYKLYGGKLAGILTQSMCREIFFDSLKAFASWVDQVPNVQIVGQFHDEIVVEYWPSTALNAVVRVEVMKQLEGAMGYSPTFTGLPMAAEIKWDNRYTK